MRCPASCLDIVGISCVVAGLVAFIPGQVEAFHAGSGESVGDPFPIASLPFSARGTTCTAQDDHEAPCLGTRDQPDLVYAFQPDSDQCIQISLCESTFDTALYVFEDAVTSLVGCNDESCAAQSRLADLQIRAGHTYYIVVDGSSTCGDYVLTVETCSTCRPDCPSGALLEGEGVCGDGFVDDYNGGCSVPPYRFVDLPCSDSTLTVCGTYGIYRSAGGVGTLDLDWYRVHFEAPRQLHICLEGEGVAQLVIQGRTCDTPSILCDLAADPCTSVCCDLALPPGTYRLLVRNLPTKQVVPCGAAYRLEVSGNLCPTNVESTTWHAVKSRYR